jgi:hypothetical protein
MMQKLKVQIHYEELHWLKFRRPRNEPLEGSVSNEGTFT